MSVIKNVIFLLLCFLLTCSFLSAQQVLLDREYELKAAYIHNFTKYIDWPEEDKLETFYIGIIGDSPLYTVLNQLASSSEIKGKPIVIHKYPRTTDFSKGSIANLPSIGKCQILFVTRGTNIPAKKLDALSKKNVLLVGETEDFAINGGLINFTTKRNKLKFEINHNSVITCGFKVSPDLLKLAILIPQGEQKK